MHGQFHKCHFIFAKTLISYIDSPDIEEYILALGYFFIVQEQR